MEGVRVPKVSEGCLALIATGELLSEFDLAKFCSTEAPLDPETLSLIRSALDLLEIDQLEELGFLLCFLVPNKFLSLTSLNQSPIKTYPGSTPGVFALTSPPSAILASNSKWESLKLGSALNSSLGLNLRSMGE